MDEKVIHCLSHTLWKLHLSAQVEAHGVVYLDMASIENERPGLCQLRGQELMVMPIETYIALCPL